jgi:Fe-S-cluster containining protein
LRDSQIMTVNFSCVGCGKCCTGHHVPLTLSEARQWAEDGGEIIVLVEAFLENGLGLPEVQREHAHRRSRLVPSGATQAYVAITFAAYNPGRCRNLDENQLCRIYERRPLVCRIYPMEINPHIPLKPEAKDCPPEAWQSGVPLLAGGRLVDPALAGLIERSRQADRDDIGAKEAICALLGIRTAALKGDGFTAYFPDRTAFADAARQVESTPADAAGAWVFHVSGEPVVAQLEAAGAELASAEPNYAFIPIHAG